MNYHKDKKFGNQNHCKLYAIPSGHQNTFENQKSTLISGRGNTNVNRNSVRGTSTLQRCGKCEKMGHHTVECKNAASTCFNCGKQGHISIFCLSLKKEPNIG